MVFLDDLIVLVLVESARDHPERLVDRSRYAKLLAQLFEMVAALDVLQGSDRITGIVEEVINIGDAAARLVIFVIGFGLIGIIGRAMVRPVHVGASIGDIEITDLAFDGQRILRELVDAGFLSVPNGLQVR